jgi:hypothetical protein
MVDEWRHVSKGEPQYKEKARAANRKPPHPQRQADLKAGESDKRQPHYREQRIASMAMPRTVMCDPGAMKIRANVHWP